MKGYLAEKIARVASVIAGFALAWLLASWVDVVIHNTSSYSYASWNLFMMLLGK